MGGRGPVSCFPGTLGRISGWSLQQEMATTTTSCGPSSPRPQDALTRQVIKCHPATFSSSTVQPRILGIQVKSFPSMFESWDSIPSITRRQGCEACPQGLWLRTWTLTGLCPELARSVLTRALRLHHVMTPMPQDLCISSSLPEYSLHPNVPLSHQPRDGVLLQCCPLLSHLALTLRHPVLTDTVQGHTGPIWGQPSWPCLQELGWALWLSLRS